MYPPTALTVNVATLASFRDSYKWSRESVELLAERWRLALLGSCTASNEALSMARLEAHSPVLSDDAAFFSITNRAGEIDRLRFVVRLVALCGDSSSPSHGLASSRADPSFDASQRQTPRSHPSLLLREQGRAACSRMCLTPCTQPSFASNLHQAIRRRFLQTSGTALRTGKASRCTRN